MTTKGDLNDIKYEIDKLMRDINNKIKNVEDGKILNVNDYLFDIEKNIKYMETRVRQMEIDLQTTKNREYFKQYKPIIRQYKLKLKEINNSFKWCKKRRTSNDGEIEMMDIDRNEDKAIQYGMRLIDETDKAADRIITEVVKTQEIATETAEMVMKQTKQMKDIGNTLDDIYEETRRIKKQLKRMSRRLLTDKYIWICVCLIIVGMTFGLILKFSRPIKQKIQQSLGIHINHYNPF